MRSEIGDNLKIDVILQTRENFELAMKMAFDICSGSEAIRYRITPDRGMILYWTDSAEGRSDHDTERLPYKMKVEQAADFVWHWLQTVDYGDQPDHDGSNGKGFRIFNEAWGHIDNDWQAFVAIKPEWIEYGK